MRRRYGMPPYWRGGVPVERGRAPSTVTWTATREKTDQPEVFGSWIAQLEAAVAYLGLSLTTRDTLEGTEYLAAGRRVAIVQRRRDGGIVGWLLAMPQSDVVGKMEAEGLRRSSQWLGLHGYGAGEFVTAGPAARPPPMVVPIANVLVTALPLGTTNPNFDVGEGGKTAGAAGLILAGAGVVGGIATFAFGKKLSLGTKIAGGVVAAAMAAGGTALAIHGSSRASVTTAKKNKVIRLDNILDHLIPPADVGPQDSGDLVTFSNPDFARVKVLNRPYYDLPVEVEPVPSVHKEMWMGELWGKIGDIEYHRAPGLDLIVPGTGFNPESGAPIRPLDPKWYLTQSGTSDLLGPFLEGVTGKMTVKGFNAEPVPGTAICDKVVSVNHTAAWKSQNVMMNETEFRDADNRVICRTKMWRFTGLNFKWFAGSCKPWRTKADGFDDFIEWGPHYVSGEFDPAWGKLPHGITFHGMYNSRITEVINKGGLSSETEPSMPELVPEIEYPTRGYVHLFRTLRGYSPEVVHMYGHPAVFAGAIAELALRERPEDDWGKIWGMLGKVIGIAATICEVALPILTAINPAFGAIISSATGFAQATISEVQEAIRNIADFGVDFYNNIGDVVTNWADKFTGSIPTYLADGSIFADLPEAKKFSYMVQTCYQGAANRVGTMVNDVPKMPFVLNVVNAYQIPAAGREALSMFDDPGLWGSTTPMSLLK